MWYKNLNINLNKIINKQIVNFNISKDYYILENEKITCNFKSIKIEFLKNNLFINKKEVKNGRTLEIEIKKNFFKKILFINKELIKEENNNVEVFIYTILEEWKEFQRNIPIFTLEHNITDYTDNLKIDYLKALDKIIEKNSNHIIKRKKYLYLLGKSLDIQSRILKDFLFDEDEYSLDFEKLKEESSFPFDFLGYFKAFNLDIPNYKYICENSLEYFSSENLSLLKILIKVNKKDKKRDLYLNKYLNKDYQKRKNDILSSEFFANCSKNILIGGRDIQMNETKINFIRNGNEYYYMKFISEGNVVAFLDGIREESDSYLEDEKKEKINFNELIQSFEDETLASEFLEKYPSYRKHWKNIKFKEKENLTIPKVIDYSDITEELILGYLKLNKEHLQGNGIWGYQGERWIELKFENLLGQLQNIENIDLDYSLILQQVGNRLINETFDISKTVKSNIESKDKDTYDLILKFPLDTTNLAQYFQDDYNYINLNFIFELSIELNDIEQKFILGIPMEIKLKNPKDKEFLENDLAAIDFGTSSTCIAIKEGGHSALLSLEKNYEYKDQAFENPTNLLIKDWEKLYEYWEKRDDKFPIIERYKDIEDEYGVYNQGHSLRRSAENATKGEINASLDQLKLIPYRNITLKEKIITKPYKAPNIGIKEIELISEYEKQNKEMFDPISFYGYLLGRVAMAPSFKKIIKEFSVTVPVKFQNEVKESILNSLEKGIKLAAPINVRDEIVVKEGYEEPVAFIGAIFAKKEIQDKGWKFGSKFAVFDFGGGTLDFSFGIYRESDLDLEEEEDYDYMIEVINTAGDEKGGAEYLIHKISYSLYGDESNRNIMCENRIPFIIPDGENEIELYPRELLNGKTKPAIYNLKKINESISRKIFQGTYNKKESEVIELQDESGNYKKITLSVDKDLYVSKLKNYINNIVEIFDELIRKNFNNYDNPYENLHIFRAGNASRSNILEEIMNEKYKSKNINIHFIDEQDSNGVKPKTAVSLGELNLRTRNDIGVIFKNKLEKDSTPFEFSIGTHSIDNDKEFNEVVSIGSIDQEWKRLGRVKRETGEIILFYTKSVGLKEINNKNVKSNTVSVLPEELENGNIMWIRPKDSNKIEYTISKKQPEETLAGKIYELGRY